MGRRGSHQFVACLSPSSCCHKNDCKPSIPDVSDKATSFMWSVSSEDAVLVAVTSKHVAVAQVFKKATISVLAK